MYLENVASESSQLHKSGSSCKKSIRTSRLGASCLMTTQKAMPHRAGALGLPSKYSTRWGADFTEFGSISIRIEAVPGAVESLAFDISTRQLTRMPARNRFAVSVTLRHWRRVPQRFPTPQAAIPVCSTGSYSARTNSVTPLNRYMFASWVPSVGLAFRTR